MLIPPTATLSSSHSSAQSTAAPFDSPSFSYAGGAGAAQAIDVELLRTSLEDRIAYLTDFLGFTSADADALALVRPLVLELIPDLVDSLFEKIFEFDITKRMFLTRTNGFEGPLPKTLDELTLDSPHITFRKKLLNSWAHRVLAANYLNNQTWQYMDNVGAMHSGVSPFKHQRTMGIPPFNVPCESFPTPGHRDCAMLLGWVQQVLQTAILRVDEERLSMEEKIAACAAVGKVIWIQNDLFSRHKIRE